MPSKQPENINSLLEMCRPHSDLECSSYQGAAPALPCFQRCFCADPRVALLDVRIVGGVTTSAEDL